MSQSCPRCLSPNLLACVLLALGSACDRSASLPAPMIVSDAGMVDACQCNAAALFRDQLGFGYYRWEFTNYFNWGWACLVEGGVHQDGKMLGVGCAVEDGPAEMTSSLAVMGPLLDSMLDQIEGGRWHEAYGYCGWHIDAPQVDDNLFMTQVSCLLPDTADSCLSTRVWQTMDRFTVAPGDLLDLPVSCDQGVMISGACSFPVRDRALTILSSGFRDMSSWPYESEWQCSWHNTGTTQVEVAAVAICLDVDISPEVSSCSCCPPFEELLVSTQATATLGPGVQHVTVSCDEGDTMLAGGCMLEGDLGQAIKDIPLVQSGFEWVDHQYRREDLNRWECAWNNGSGLTPKAIATAVCLDSNPS